jgi:hypothetical protein
MSSRNPKSRLSALRRANVDTSTRERHSGDHAQAGRVPIPPLSGHKDDMSPKDDNFSSRQQSPKTREYDQSQSPPRDDAYMRNRNKSRLEHQPDAVQGKRRFCEEISLVIKDTNKRRRSE